jgi:hypothetical protein
VPVSGASAGGEVEAAVDEVAPAPVATVLDGGVPPQAGTGADLADGHAEGVRGKNRETFCCILCCFDCFGCFLPFSFGYLVLPVIVTLYVKIVQILPIYQSLILLMWIRKRLLIARVCICKLAVSFFF